MHNKLPENRLFLLYEWILCFLDTCLWLWTNDSYKSNERQFTWTAHATDQWEEVLHCSHQTATHLVIVCCHQMHQNNASCKTHTLTILNMSVDKNRVIKKLHLMSLNHRMYLPYSLINPYAHLIVFVKTNSFTCQCRLNSLYSPGTMLLRR